MTLEELKVVISAETKGLEKAVKGVKSTLKGLTKTVDTVTKKMTTQFDRVGKSINKSLSGLLKFAGITVLTTQLVKLGKTAIQAASDLEVIQRRSAVVFGESSKDVDKWANNLLQKFGMSEGEAKTLAAGFKGMADSMGVVGKTSTNMSLRLSELSADMASFYGESTDTISNALNAIFTGNARALRQFNIALTDANLSSYAVAQGMKKTYKEMSEAEKVMLRYNYVMAQTAGVQGNFARTANTWAGQLRIMKSQWGDLMEVLGQALKQVLTPVLKVLNNILATVITITKHLFTLLGIDFSSTAAQVSSAGASAGDIADGLDDATGSAKKLNKEIAGFDELETIGDKSASGLSDLADALGDTASDLEITMPETSAEDMDNSMFRSMREALQNLQSWFETTMDPWLVDKSTKFANWLNGIFGDKETWGQVGSTVAAGLNGIIHALDAFWTNLNGYNIGAALGELFNKLTSGLDWQALGHAWGEKLKTALDIAIGFLETYNFQQFGEKIAEALDSVDWKGIGNKLAKLISDMLLAAMDFAIGLSTGNLGSNISDFIDGWAEGWKGEELKQKFLNEFKPAMQEAWNELWSSLEANETLGTLITDIEELTKTISELILVLGGLKIFTGIFTALTTGLPILTLLSDKLFGLSTWAEGFQVAANGLVSPLGFLKNIFYQLSVALTDANGAFLGISESMAESVGIIGAVIAVLVGAYKNSEKFRESVNELARDWIESIKAIWDQIKAFFNDNLVPIVQEIWELIKYIFKQITKGVGDVLAYIMPIVQSLGKFLLEEIRTILEAVNGVMKFLKGLVEFLGGVFTGDIDKIIQGLKDMWGGFCDTFVSLIKGAINIIIGFVNVLASALGGVVRAIANVINKISIKIPDFVPGIGGKSWSPRVNWATTIPQVPYLAKGGVLDSPTLAMLGEYAGARNNPEIAAPESKIRDIVVNANGEMVQALYQMAQQIITTIEGVDMTVQIGDETIARAAQRGSDQYYKMTGKPMYAY